MFPLLKVFLLKLQQSPCLPDVFYVLVGIIERPKLQSLSPPCRPVDGPRQKVLQGFPVEPGHSLSVRQNLRTGHGFCRNKETQYDL